jgi:hypothetical protein
MTSENSQPKNHRNMMQSRTEVHDSLDLYPTPPWATRALIEHVIMPVVGRDMLGSMTVWEPACGLGDMVYPLEEYFRRVVGSDVHPYKPGQYVCDFLIPGTEPGSIAVGGAHWIITNPPFNLAEQFIERAREVKNARGVAMLVRTSFLEGVGRYKRLFSIFPPTIVAQFVERVPMVKGRLTATGSTATSYCWMVWINGLIPRPMFWIPPCRKAFEHSGDYTR